MRQLLCTLLDLSTIGFFESYELHSGFFFSFFFSPFKFFFFYRSLLGYWFWFESLFCLYRVSLFLSDFPVYSPHSRIISRFRWAQFFMAIQTNSRWFMMIPDDFMTIHDDSGQFMTICAEQYLEF